MTSSKHDFEGSRKRELILFIKSLKQISDGSKKFIGSVALFGKVLLVRIVENDKIDAYFRAG